MSEYLDHMPHLERISESQGATEYVVRSPIPDDLADFIICGLPPDRELGFYDPFYPSMSDPGAYISVRQQSDCYVYFFGNHGWSSGWQKQSREFLSHYLKLCLPAHCPPIGRERLLIRPVKPMDKDRLVKS
jgi:hypothetical protein